MTFSVELSEMARKFLNGLAERDKAARRDLALLLVRLKKHPKEEGSRALQSVVAPDPAEREWKYGRFEILYRLDEKAHLVKIGVIKIEA